MINDNITATAEALDNSPIIYAGFPSPDEASIAGMSMDWKVYPATADGRRKLIEDGYQAVSIYEFSQPLDDKRNTVIRYGDLILDFDAKKEIPDFEGNITCVGDIGKSLVGVRNFTQLLIKNYQVNPELLQYYASGGKGFHLVIPRGLIGSENGDPQLPEIYLNMIAEITRLSSSTIKEVADGSVSDSLKAYKRSTLDDYCIDRNGFKMGKGQLIRLPHIKRPNGSFKVPVTYEEIIKESPEFFEDVVKNDRYLDNENEVYTDGVSSSLSELYLKCKSDCDRHYKGSKRNINIEVSTLESKCEFVRYCKEYPEQVTEPQWFCLARLLTRYGEMGRDIFHKISRLDHQRYNEAESDKKFMNAYQDVLKGKHPPTCNSIRKLFNCTRDCGVKSPSDLYKKELPKKQGIDNFGIVNDRLVYFPDKDNKDEYEDICSRIEVKALVRDEHSNNWSKLVELTDPDGTVHLCRLADKDLGGLGESALKIVLDAGLMISPGKTAENKVKLYLQSSIPTPRGIMYQKNGWTGDECRNYLPYDLGLHEKDNCYILKVEEDEKPVYEIKGTLKDWQEKIGVLCRDNWLLIVAAVAGLSGACVRMFLPDGFGVHLYGPSSKGKTTALYVTASVTGGSIGNWRATDNGLEAIAVSYNDGTIILDESGQCQPDVLHDSVYMLFNGTGKRRSRKNGTAKKCLTWKLVGVSTGEESIIERINKGFKSKGMAGHDVRMVSILADLGEGLGVFNTIPEGFKDAQELSKKIKSYADEVKGSPLKAWIEVIKFNPNSIRNSIERHYNDFIEEYSDKNLSTQAMRICANFAFMAGVGEAAILHEILPLKPGSSVKAMKFTFERWLEHNKGTEDFELEKAIEDFLKDARNKFPGSYDSEVKRGGAYSNSDELFVSKPYIQSKYCKWHQYNRFIMALNKRGLLECTRNGDIRIQWTSGTARPRGIYLVWEKLFEDEEDSNNSITINKDYPSGIDTQEIKAPYESDNDDKDF